CLGTCFSECRGCTRRSAARQGFNPDFRGSRDRSQGCPNGEEPAPSYQDTEGSGDGDRQGNSRATRSSCRHDQSFREGCSIRSTCQNAVEWTEAVTRQFCCGETEPGFSGDCSIGGRERLEGLCIVNSMFRSINNVV